MLRGCRTFAVLGLIPAGIGVYLWFRGAGPVSLAVSAYATALAAAVSFVLRAPGEFQMVARAAADRERDLSRQREELQARVDLLSAEREVSLVLNEDVDFRTILDRVLSITCDTFGADVDLWMPQGERLLPRAARTAGKTEFDLESREDRRVRECFEGGRLLFEAEEGRFRALAPLQSDREIMGVVRLTMPPEADAAVRETRAKILARQIEEFSKFLALAIKTPDLYTRAVQDGLTGLWTKRHFLSQAPLAIEASRRYGEPLALIMVDVDHFKKVNDTYGHQTGDKVLQGVAAILKARVRGGSVFRYGGEEMAVLLPKTSLAEAAPVAERLRKAIEARKIAGIRVTASLGVSELDAAMSEAGDLVERADQALYRAKESGRNRVMTAESPPPESVPTRRVQRSA
jgi:diguanylate cyclase (GGDEF)-like protein